MGGSLKLSEVFVEFIGRDMGLDAKIKNVRAQIQGLRGDTEKTAKSMADLYSPLSKKINQHPLKYMAGQMGLTGAPGGTGGLLGRLLGLGAGGAGGGGMLGVLSSTAGGLVAVGAAITGIVAGLTVMTAWAIRAAEEIDDVNKTAKLLGESASEVTSYSLAARVNNVSQGEMNLGFKMWLRNGREIIANTGGAAQALRQLGIEGKDSAGRLRPLLDILPEIADALKEYDAASRLIIAQELFGKSAPSLVPMLSEGGGNLSALRRISEVGGIPQTDTQSKAGGIISSDMAYFWEELKAVGRELLVAVTPLLTLLLKLTNAVLTVINWLMRGINWLSNSKLVDAIERATELVMSWFGGESGTPGTRSLTPGEAGALGSGSGGASFMGLVDLAKQVQLAAAGNDWGKAVLSELKDHSRLLSVIARGSPGVVGV